MSSRIPSDNEVNKKSGLRFPIINGNNNSKTIVPQPMPVSEYVPEDRIVPRIPMRMRDRANYIPDELRTQPETRVYLGAKNFAFMGGITLMAAAFISLFYPGTVTQMLPMISTSGSGWFLGYFPLNLVFKSMLFLIGITGFVASTHLGAAINWSKFVAIVMGAFTVMGLLTPLNTFFGYIPLYGANVVLNGTFAIMGAYFAYYSNPKNATRTDY